MTHNQYIHSLCMPLQGDTVTKGLKKVTDDMKTKNRADKLGAVSTSAGIAHERINITVKCIMPKAH